MGTVKRRSVRAVDGFVRGIDQVADNRLAFWSGMLYLAFLNSLPHHGWDILWNILGMTAGAFILGFFSSFWRKHRIAQAVRDLDTAMADPNWHHKIVILPPDDQQ